MEKWRSMWAQSGRSKFRPGTPAAPTARPCSSEAAGAYSSTHASHGHAYRIGGAPREVRKHLVKDCTARLDRGDCSDRTFSREHPRCAPIRTRMGIQMLRTGGTTPQEKPLCVRMRMCTSPESEVPMVLFLLLSIFPPQNPATKRPVPRIQAYRRWRAGPSDRRYTALLSRAELSSELGFSQRAADRFWKPIAGTPGLE